MKKNILKRAMSLTMVAAMALSMAGCGGSAEETSTASDSTASAETSEGGTFKIGGIGPTTGSVAIAGASVKAGAEIAVEEINAAGGINGMMVEMNYQDDEHDAEKAINAYNTLKDWGMQVLMGTVTSNPCIGVAPEAEADNMFLLTPCASAVECIVADNAFRVCFSDPNQGAASAQYIVDNDVADKVAVIYDSSDVYSSGIYESFAAGAAEYGVDIVETQAFTSESRTDFSVQIQKAKSSGAELVYIPIYYSDATLILAEAVKQGYDARFFGCDGLDGILNVEGFDTSLAEGLMLLTPFAADATDDLTVSFVEKYMDKVGEVPNQYAADGYDAIYIIKAAAEAAGVTADMDYSTICDAIVPVMTEITVAGLTGPAMTWEAGGEPNKDPKVVEIVDGAYVLMQ